ncbi:ATP-binding protein [Planctobacterium marinum]|uniref:ATP-binding protein n=1 Tax=Planctobacterium marinum TaxID=1631968 RepID=UPI001E28B7B2|nr:transporter substrate-binding domain-containing protein [Planctobacterium marinum]MCC2605071.1 transporter substrate-binding domain-containing protein [Planctobacterium marinum]
MNLNIPFTLGLLVFSFTLFPFKSAAEDYTTSFNALSAIWGASIGNQASSNYLLEAHSEDLDLGRNIYTLCIDPQWPPFDILSTDNQHKGIFSEYLSLIAHELDIEWQLIPTNSWSQTLRFFRQGKCQFISGLNATPEREQIMLFSDVFLSAPMVIISRQDQPYVANLHSLAGKSLASVSGYRIAKAIQHKYPMIDIVYVNSTQDALRAVSRNTAYATVGSIFGMSYNVDALQLNNLKIIGHTEFTGQYRIAMQKQLSPLLPTLNMAIATISEQQKNIIINRWIRFMDYENIDYTWVWWTIAITGILSLVLVVRYYSILSYSRRLVIANEQLRIANDEQETLMKMVSHQYRTPLAIIESGLRLLRAELTKTSHTANDRIAAMGRATKRMKETLSISLGELHLPNTSVYADNSERTILAEVLAQVVQQFRDQDTGVNVTIKGYTDVHIAMPSAELRCCLDNILSNAFKYSATSRNSDAGQSVSICCKSIDPEWLLIKVKDNGVGIPRTEHDKIFSKFYRAQNSAEFPGVGIGLAIVRQIVSKYGGMVYLNSQITNGCEFLLQLPINTTSSD